MRRRGGPSGDDEAETLGERAVTGRQRATDQLDHQTKATLDELRGALGRLRTAFRADGDDDDGDRTTGPARPPSGGARPRVFVRSGHEVLAGSVRDLVNVVAPGSAIAVSVLYLKRPGVRFGPVSQRLLSVFLEVGVFAAIVLAHVLAVEESYTGILRQQVVNSGVFVFAGAGVGSVRLLFDLRSRLRRHRRYLRRPEPVDGA